MSFRPRAETPRAAPSALTLDHEGGSPPVRRGTRFSPNAGPARAGDRALICLRKTHDLAYRPAVSADARAAPQRKCCIPLKGERRGGSRAKVRARRRRTSVRASGPATPPASRRTRWSPESIDPRDDRVVANPVASSNDSHSSCRPRRRTVRLDFHQPATRAARRTLRPPPTPTLLTTHQVSLDAADRLVAPPTGLLTLGFDPARFQTEPPARYRASWQLPGGDSQPLATTSYVGSPTYSISTTNSGHTREKWLSCRSGGEVSGGFPRNRVLSKGSRRCSRGSRVAHVPGDPPPPFCGSLLAV